MGHFIHFPIANSSMTRFHQISLVPWRFFVVGFHPHTTSSTKCTAFNTSAGPMVLKQSSWAAHFSRRMPGKGKKTWEAAAIFKTGESIHLVHIYIYIIMYILFVCVCDVWVYLQFHQPDPSISPISPSLHLLGTWTPPRYRKASPWAMASSLFWGDKPNLGMIYTLKTIPGWRFQPL